MKINNLIKMIKDFEEIFNTVLDDRDIYSIIDNIKLVMYAQGVQEGDTFYVEEEKYYRHISCSLDIETIYFNFKLTEETDDQEVITYLGYNKYLKEKMKINNLDELIKDFEEFFYTVFDDGSIPWIIDDIKIGMDNKGVGDTFYVEQKKYYKNKSGSLDSKMIYFNFELTVKTCDQQVITYLGYSK